MSLGYADIFGGGVWTVFLAFVGKSTSDRRNIDQLDSARIKDFLHQRTQYHQESEKTTQGTAENICKSCLTRNLYPEYIKDYLNSAVQGQSSHGQRL